MCLGGDKKHEGLIESWRDGMFGHDILRGKSSDVGAIRRLPLSQSAVSPETGANGMPAARLHNDKEVKKPGSLGDGGLISLTQNDHIKLQYSIHLQHRSLPLNQIGNTDISRREQIKHYTKFELSIDLDRSYRSHHPTYARFQTIYRTSRLLPPWLAATENLPPAQPKSPKN